MEIKKYIHDLFFLNQWTRKLYCYISFAKKKIYYGVKLVLPIYKYKKNSKDPVFLIFTPEHANLGDHAIAYAEQQLLERIGVSYYEITGKNLYLLEHYGYLKIMNGALILVNGGGNLGTLWPDIERMNRCIIEFNPDSNILILPNTIYYEDSEYGIEEFEKSKIIYNQHKNLVLYAREEISYQIMREAYKNVKLIPDMVLALNESEENLKREGCLLCLRNDVEKTLSLEETKLVHEIVERQFRGKVKETETVLDYYVPVYRRKNELAKKFKEFKSAELVITDRLHGMIFCAITGTNCIVLNSKSPKLKGCYQWISDLGYIKFAERVEEIDILYDDFSRKSNIYENHKIVKRMKELEDDIKDALDI